MYDSINRHKIYDDQNNKIFTQTLYDLNYKSIPEWQPRTSINNTLFPLLANDSVVSKSILEMKKDTDGIYVFDNIDATIIYNLTLSFSSDQNINNHLFNFKLKHNSITIASISTLGCKLFCTSKRKIEREPKQSMIHYPIYLFDCFEDKYLDLSLFDTPPVLYVEHMLRNPDVIPLTCQDITLSVSTIKLDKPQLPPEPPANPILSNTISRFVLKEQIIFEATDENKKRWTTISSSPLYSSNFYPKKNIKITNYSPNTMTFNMNPIGLIHTIHLSFFHDPTSSTKFPLLKDLKLHINNKTIDQTSSRIIINNKTNFHVIQLVPDLDDDPIKDKFIIGMNLSSVPCYLTASFYDTDPNQVRVCIGILKFDILTADLNKKNITMYIN